MTIFILLIISCLALLVPYYPYLTILLVLMLFLNRKKSCLKYYLIASLIFLTMGLLTRFFTPALTGTQIGLVVKRESNYIIIKTILSQYYIRSKNNTFTIGDIIQISGISKPHQFPVIEKGFDYTLYLQRLGATLEIQVPEIKTIFRFPLRTEEIANYVSRSYNENTKALIEGLIFNNKDYDAPIVQYFNKMDLIFLLSSSGIHIHLLLTMLEKGLSLLTNKKVYQKSIPLLILIPLWLVNLDKFIFYKIFLLKIIQFINKEKFNQQYSYLELLSISGLVLLFFNPYLIFSMSFYVSYGLSFYIYFLRPIIKRRSKHMRPIVSFLLIYLFLVPIRITNSNFLDLINLPLQLVMSPMIGIYFVFSLLSVYMLGQGAYFLNFGSNLIEKILENLKFPSLGFNVGNLSIYALFISYLVIFILVNSTYSKHRPLQRAAAFTLIAIFMLYTLPVKRYISQSVTFINVGQGDATLIRDYDKTILIDTGGSHYYDIANETLIPYFRSQHISYIDLVVITHDDFDHNGALEELMSNFRIKQVIDEAEAFPLTIGSITLNNLNQSLHMDDNENSLVLEFNLMDRHWLMMGDASIQNESEIVDQYKNLRIDVLKIGHHGSKTSTSEAFLRHINPETAIISVGRDNYYGHPHPEVIKRLEMLKIETRRTDVEGTITYVKYGF